MKINDTTLEIGTKPYISGVKSKDNICLRTNLISGLHILGKDYPSSQTEFTKKDDEEVFEVLYNILCACRMNSWDKKKKNAHLKKYYSFLGLTESEIKSRLFDVLDEEAESTASESKTSSEDIIKMQVKAGIESLIKFCSEFNFSPSYRFINSFALATNKIDYMRNYFAVQDHQYSAEISEKIKSSEFKNIIKIFNGFSPKHVINTRFELYFGEPGAGKTTKAMTLADKCIVCSSDMLPADLMQNFCFKDGKADFDPSDLWIAMEEGKAIVLDEVNMLPFESLRFLQGITDGKETIDYKGRTIKIHPNFKIYATMNLNVNGQCIPLPAPLVDRAYDIKEFKLTADDLISAIL